jgi:hypothetical protein
MAFMALREYHRNAMLSEVNLIINKTKFLSGIEDWAKKKYENHKASHVEKVTGRS